jgi:hypothetical protein
VALYWGGSGLLLPRLSMALERLSLSVEMDGRMPRAKKQQNLVPGARHGPNVCRFVSSGWPRHKSEANLDWVSGRLADA